MTVRPDRDREVETDDRLLPIRSAAVARSLPAFRLDVVNEQLWRGECGIPLQPKTFAVLRYLVERPRQLVRKAELLAEFWRDAKVGEAVLKTCLSEIRHALCDSARAPSFIETAHRRGYRFIGRIEIGARSTGGAQSSAAASLEAVGARGLRQAIFVGRQRELLWLHDRFAVARHGERQMVFVCGEPGIGKTALIDAFVESVENSKGVSIARGQCIEQYGAGEPYLPILEALGRLCRGPRAQQVIDILGREAPSWLLQVPGLPSRATAERMSARSAPERMLREMAQALEALSELAPCVIVLEDLHWADLSTLELLSYVVERSGPAALLIIGSYRPCELHGEEHRRRRLLQRVRGRRGCEELVLPRLNERCTSEYLDSRFPRHDFLPALAKLLCDRTSGNPLFMVRVVDSWLEQGALQRVNGRWQCSTTLNSVSRDVPDSVRGMIEAECERLAAFEQRVLEAASVAGAEFSTAAIAAALSEDIVTIEELCARWARREQFVVMHDAGKWPDGTLQIRCRFIHALYQEVLYHRTPPTRRARIHQRIGERQEAGYAHLVHTISAELALHFERGQDHERATSYSRIAGEQALKRVAFREAIDHFTRALDLLKRAPSTAKSRLFELELLIVLGGALSAIHGYAAPEVEHVYTRARALCQVVSETPHLFPLIAGMGEFYLVRADYAVAREIAQQLLVAGQSGRNPSVLAEGNMLLGAAQLYLGEFSAAAAHLLQACEGCSPEREGSDAAAYNQDASIAARSWASVLFWIRGYPDQAARHATEAVERAGRLDHPLTRTLALFFAAFVHRLCGDTEACLEQLQASISLATRHGFTFFLAMARIERGAIQIERGEVEVGLGLVSRGWAEFQATGAQLGGTHFRVRLAGAHAASCNFQAALDTVDQALVAAHRTNERLWEPELYRMRGELLHRSESHAGQCILASDSLPNLPTSSEACFRKALEVAEGTGAKGLELRAAMSLARSCAPGRGRQRACARLRGILNWFGEGRQTFDLMEAQRLLRQLTE